MAKRRDLFNSLLFRPLSEYVKSRWSFFVSEPIKEISFKNLTKTNVRGLISEGNSSLYRFLFFCLSVMLLLLMPVLSLNFGINWDEIDSENYGNVILKYILTFGKDKTVLDKSMLANWHLIYFGSSFDFIVAFVNKYLSPFGIFETRHILVALTAFITMLFTALITQKVCNWRGALLTMLFLVLSPRFLGHSMNSAKDIPFAMGYVVSIYFMIRIFETLPRAKLQNIIFLILGIAFTISNKIAGFILIPYFGLFSLIIFYYNSFYQEDSIKKRNDLKSHILLFLKVAVISYGLGLAFWPYAHLDLINNPIIALRKLQDIGSLVTHYEIFEGVKINMTNIPWYYTLKFMSITIPIYVLIGFLVFIVGFYWLIMKGKLFEDKTKQIIVIFLLFITFLPILFAIYKHSKLYNGWRHFLFIYPSFVVLSTIGWEALVKIFKRKLFKILIAFILLLLILKPTIWMMKNHPNQITYFNELIGGTNGAYAMYETDPMVNSGRQAIEWLIENEPVLKNKTIVVTNVEPKILEYWAEKHTDSIEFKWTREYLRGEGYRDYAIFASRTYSPTQLINGSFPPKGTIHEIKTDNIPLIAIVRRENNYRQNGYVEFYDKNFDQAISNFKEFIKYDPKDEEVYRMLGRCYFYKKDYSKALKNIKKSIELNPDNFAGYDIKGEIYNNLEEYEKAIHSFSTSINLRHNYLPALENLGETYFLLEKYDSSMHWFKLIIKYYSRQASAYLGLAENYRVLTKYNRAFDMYNVAIQLEPMNDGYKSRKKSLKSFIEKQKSLKNVKYLTEFELVDKYLQNNKENSALIVLNKILQKEHTNSRALLRRGVAYLNLGKLDMALQDLHKAEKLDSNNYDIYFNIGIVYAQMGKFERAVENHGKALKLNPESYIIQNERAFNYINLKKYDLALKDFNRSVKIKKDQYEAFYGRALIYYLQRNMFKALDDLNKVILRSPYHSEAYYLRSKIYFEENNYKKALDDVTVAKNLGYAVDDGFFNQLKKQVE